MGRRRWGKAAFKGAKRGRPAMVLGWLGWLSILAAQASTFISPEWTAVPALAGLAFPVGAIFWVVGMWTAVWSRRWKASLLMALAGAFAAPSFQATWGCGGCGFGAGEGRSLTVMSWNVRLFDYYGWLGQEGAAGEAGAKAGIMDAIEGAAPDVLCLQEYFTLDEQGRFPVEVPLNEAVAQGQSAHRHVVIARSKGPRSFGVATWSRWPIVGRSSIVFGTRKNNVCAVTDVAWEKDTVRVFNAHFSSMRFEEEDYAALEEGVPNAAGRERIWSRMKAAYVERVAQVTTVMEAVEESPHPVVLCGDFNDTPTSWAHAHCRLQLKDSHDARLFRMDGTWQGAVPGVRIDHLLVGPQWTALDYATGGDGLSDHRFVKAVLQAVSL